MSSIAPPGFEQTPVVQAVAPTPVAVRPARRLLPRWRKMTWAIFVFTGIMLAWAIGGAGAATNSHAIAQCVQGAGGVLSSADCKSAGQVGAGIGVALLGVLWFVGFIVLSIIWFMTKPRRVQ